MKATQPRMFSVYNSAHSIYHISVLGHSCTTPTNKSPKISKTDGSKYSL